MVASASKTRSEAGGAGTTVEPIFKVSGKMVVF